MNRIPNYFIKDFKEWNTVDLFRKVLYVFLILNTLSLLPIAFEIWGYDGISGSRGWNFEIPVFKQFSYAITNVLSHPATSSRSWIYWLMIIGQLSFLILGLFNKFPKLSSVAVYFFTVNLFLKGAIMFTGGEVLVNLLLFYLMFIQYSDKIGEKIRFTPIQNILNNTFFLIARIQLCVVYFFSSLYKWLDPNWYEGKAMMYISEIDGYSSSLASWIFNDNLTLSIIATYFTLIYQSLFPVLVWFKSIKRYYLVFGVIFHLAIAFGMGIFTFGVIMCLVYILFLNEEDVIWLRKKLRFKEKDVVTECTV